MAGGRTRDGAVLDQIDDTIIDGVLTARARISAGKGTEDCIECGDPTSEARRRAAPGVTTCVPCQSGRDGRVVVAGINRRGSKDSQLR